MDTCKYLSEVFSLYSCNVEEKIFACCNFTVAMPVYLFLLPFPHHLLISGKEGEHFSQEVKTSFEFFSLSGLYSKAPRIIHT